MRKYSIVIFSLLLFAFQSRAEVNFNECFADSTLRLDYIMAGDSSGVSVYLSELARTDGWAGRRHNLDRPFLTGNGSVTVRDHLSGDTLYVNTFSTLFQEWICTDEATKVAKAFESTYLVPFPRRMVDVTLALTDNRHQPVASITHTVDPEDILIRDVPHTSAPCRYIRQSGSPSECVDIVIVAEGYTADETEKFFSDAQRAADALFSHEPFSDMADKFNVAAVASRSAESGTSVPREKDWRRTAHRSHFDTFYSDRYLTTQSLFGIHDSIAGVPTEHIILLVNTPRYGGGGIFNQITLCTSDHPTFRQVLVHEFGHAYGGLGDEYFYPGEEDATYPVDVEPWEPNITTLVDFDSKWADMLSADTPIPTPVADVPAVRSLNPENKKDAEILKSLTHKLGVYEGAGYKTHGIYRPTQECRMKVNEVGDFCPVCTRALIDITNWYTE